ncbi:ABC transporter [Scenedesmus sp. NREL 46B-D3]|nr:ABC transporter [Scenedesmus sp. NREL 46B-D3]
MGKQQPQAVKKGSSSSAPPVKIGEPGFFSKLFFLFIDPLIKYGHRTTLQPENLYAPKAVLTGRVHGVFENAWQRELKSGHPDIRKAVVANSLGGLIFTGLLYAISLASQLVGPMMLNRIVGGLQCWARQGGQKGGQCPTANDLYYFVIAISLAPLVQSLAENQMQFQLNVVGLKMRNGLMAAIYRKCLRLSNSALQSESTGRVVTLMSNDAQKVQDVMLAIHTLWGAPALIIVILVLLYQQVGWATFVGFGVALLYSPLSTKVSRRLIFFRRGLMQWTDARVSLMNEIVNSIQMIKFYAWEGSFKAAVMEVRAKEAAILKRMLWWQALFTMLLFSGPVMMAVAVFAVYAATGHVFNAATAYTSLALFNLLRLPLAFLPMMVTMLINALIALNRIGDFLTKSESGLAALRTAAEGMPAGSIKVEGGDFSWEAGSSEASLAGVNFTAAPGTLTMVVGSVGSGKSSILAALIGQMERVSGTVAVGGRVAYVAQTAWIVNDSVQENVIMGEAFEASQYRVAVDVAQLLPDLEILPNGDATEIGDRGVTLSGGQKQRVSIARAVYADADVYLLDDPLSAVDSHVGRALFERCIRGVLAGKTVVLVTNALQYLPYADNVLWMDGGRVRAQGSTSSACGSSSGRSSGDAAASTQPSTDSNAVLATIKAAPAGSQAAAGSAAAGAGKLSRPTADANRNLTGVEEREKGNVSGGVISAYIAAGGGLLIVALLVLIMAAEQGARVFTDTWLGFWAANAFNQEVWFYIGIYAALGITYSLITFARTLRFMYTTVEAAVTLHNRLLTHMLRLPKVFFDTNPAGRILNRFSRDVETMDSVLNQSLIQFSNCFASYLAILVVISISTRWFGVAIVPLTVIYVIIQRYYIPSARELQRIESITRSPIYSKFSEALAGVATIRAYRREEYFTAASDELMELNAYAFVTQRAAASWLAMRLDFMGLVILTCAAVLCISGNISPALAGLCLVYALDLTRYLKHGTAMASKTESDFNSVERVVQYLQPATEAPEETAPDVAATLPAGWPAAGALSVRDLKLRYRPGLPLVLRGVSFEVSPGEKVGLVGRTGSGKSSLLLALFRMVEVDPGSILIDGVDIRLLGLKQLRSQMSIIPQDPFMFSGTVRSNLDPFSSYAELDLWRVLDAVGLKVVISSLADKLDARVVDGGNNFSQGQKQLFCMARAMLRNSRVLMLDEATASVDPETDRLIQAAIRSVFTATTMLTIAHRLNTIMDADRVLVLDQGLLIENGEPHELLQKQAGIFSGMVEQTGSSSSAYLRDVAREASYSRAATRSAASGTALHLHHLRQQQDSMVIGAACTSRAGRGGCVGGVGGGAARWCCRCWQVQQESQRAGPEQIHSAGPHGRCSPDWCSGLHTGAVSAAAQCGGRCTARHAPGCSSDKAAVSRC